MEWEQVIHGNPHKISLPARQCDKEDVGTLSEKSDLFMCPPKTGLKLKNRLMSLEKEFFKFKIKPNYDGPMKKEEVDDFINNLIVERLQQSNIVNM